MLQSSLAFFYLPFFLLIFGIASYTDWKRKKVNALGFYFLKGLLYTGLFLLPDKYIFTGLLITGAYLVFSLVQESVFKMKLLARGDFIMLEPLSILFYMFFDLSIFILAHVGVVLAAFTWILFFKDRSFAPALFFIMVVSFVGLFYLGFG